MNRQLRLNKWILISLVSIYAYDLLFWLFSGYGGYEKGYEDSIGGAGSTQGGTPIVVSIDYFFVLIWISIFCCLYLLSKISWRNNIPKRAYYLYMLLLLCNLICFIRGGVSASGYFDIKNLFAEAGGGLSQFAPVILVTAMSIPSATKIFKTLITILKGSLILIPFQIIRALATEESYAQIVIPVTMLLLLAPYLPYKKKILIFVVAAASFFLTIEWRTNELRLILLFLFLMLISFRKITTNAVYNFINIILLCTPIVLMITGVVTGKTIFQEASGHNQKTEVIASGQQVDLQGDTRTYLYLEVLSDLTASNALLFGKGASGKYKSDFFTESAYKKGRGNVEVGALKILLYSGITGLLLTLLVLCTAIYYGTNRSNNTLTKFFAFFLALHWMLLFVENMVSYNIYYYILWFVTGLCLSKNFRQLSNSDIKSFFAKHKPKRLNERQASHSSPHQKRLPVHSGLA